MLSKEIQQQKRFQKARINQGHNILKILNSIKNTDYIFDSKFIQGYLRNNLISYGILLDKEGIYNEHYDDINSRKISRNILKKTLKQEYESFLRISAVIEEDDSIYDILIILGGNSEYYHRSFRKRKLRQFIQKSRVVHVLMTKNNEVKVKIGEDPTIKETV